MKKYFYLYFFPIIIIACSKEKCVRYVEIESQIINPQETYHIGDTIQFLSKFSKFRPGYNSEYNYIKDYDMSNFKWQPRTNIIYLDTVEFGASYISKHFKYVKNPDHNYNIDNFSNGASDLTGEYTYKNDSFYLDFKVVTQKEGIFALFHNSGIMAGSFQQQNFPGKCDKYNGIDVYTIMKDSAKMNFELLKLSNHNYYNNVLLNSILFPNKNIAIYQTMGIFCFRVVP